MVPLLLGMAITLTLGGYQFGSGNHAVYLLAPLREVHPELLRNDWWINHTLQYHWAFTQMTAALMRVHCVEMVFFALYLMLVVLLHTGWLRMVLALGYSSRVYLLSVLLYFLSAAGLGLGSYEFLQDHSFLPGNVANVAMLWGVLYIIEKRSIAAACSLAVAALFHLNHAIVAMGLWPVWWVFLKYQTKHEQDARGTSFGLALLEWGLIGLCALPNLLPALRASFAGGAKMPLGEFVDLYVHLRHPHHYDPLAWPLALWIAFLWPIPLAVVAWRKCARIAATRPAMTRAGFLFGFFMFLQIIPLLFAGVSFVSEPLIQMSLFRFSIYMKLLVCIGAAGWLVDEMFVPWRGARLVLIALPVFLLGAIGIARAAAPASAAGLFIAGNVHPLLIFTALLAAACIMLVRRLESFPPLTALAVAVLLAIILWSQRDHLGVRLALQDDDDGDYLALCDFVRGHTPIDALFVVPPNEQVFRYRAQRAIVVNFKNVPQLSGEMREWKSRLETVLGEPLAELPRRFDLAHAAIAEHYAGRGAAELAEVAARYHAEFVVTLRTLPGFTPLFENARYHLYAAHELASVTASGAASEGRAYERGRTAETTQVDPRLAGGAADGGVHPNAPASGPAEHTFPDPRP